jgi:hypothetical protein
VKNGNRLPGARRVLGLVGIKEDLNTVADMCIQANQLLDGDPAKVHHLNERQLTMLQALFTSAVVVYARCFVVTAKSAADLRKQLVGPVGLEPTTSGLKVRCSTN